MKKVGDERRGECLKELTNIRKRWRMLEMVENEKEMENERNDLASWLQEQQ